MKKIAMLFGLILSLNVNAGAIVQADFTFGWFGSMDYSGSLSGEDLDNDGFLRTGELTSIFESLDNHNISTLFDIGDIEIATQTWTPNALSWNGYPTTAFMTFENRRWSCSTYNGCNAAFTSFDVTEANVSEPASFALLGIGLLGLGLIRRRNAA